MNLFICIRERELGWVVVVVVELGWVEFIVVFLGFKCYKYNLVWILLRVRGFFSERVL